VTIATNMAGRGTDILVEPGLDARIIAGYLSLAHDLLADGAGEVRLSCGSTAEADALLAGVRADGGGLSESYSSRYRAVSLKKPSGSGAGRVVTLEFGLGLYVIATEMNRSRRADRQLRGRTARQGAFGSSRLVLSAEDVRQSFPGGSGADFARRSAAQGPGTERMLVRSQRLTEDEDEAHRSYVSEYGSVLDAQTVAYYRARREVAHSVSFHGVCEDMVMECAGRLVQRHFPDLRVTNYPDRFDRLVREVESEFGVDCAGLFGSALPALAGEVGALMLARLDTLRDAFGDKRLEEIEKSLFVQTSDEAWTGHLADLEGLVMGIAAELDGRAAAMSRFALRAFETYGQFKDRAVDAFIAELLTLPVNEQPVHRDGLVEIMEEAASILAPEVVTSDADD
jgi:preprotein translocase subunit SecA